MPLTDPIALLILLGTVLASAVSAAFAFGGMFVLLAIMSAVMPIHDVIPVQTAILVGSQVSRGWLVRKHIHWPIVWPFSLGCVVGAFAGARVYLSLPEAAAMVVIAVLMLAAAWAPPVRYRLNIPHPWILLGIVHAFLSTISSFGGLLQPVLMRSSLNRHAVTGTLAGALFGMSVFKLAGFATFGFDFKPYAALIATGWLAAVPGSWLGHHVLQAISEQRFRQVFRILLTLFALRLLYRAMV